MSDSQPEFGKLRSFFWPIYSFELKKVLPMLFMFFFILFNYTVLRDTKDTLIVTSGGAEVIPFLKFWGVLPMAVVFMLLYSKMSNLLSKPALFYSTVTPFIVFFGLFAVVLYPNREMIHPNAFCDWLQGHLPAGFHGLVSIIRYWTFSLFYIMSELWGSMALSLLFWGFANDITKVSESKRFYALFAIGANASLILGGWVVRLLSQLRDKLPSTVTDPWQFSLSMLMLVVVLSGLLIMGIYYWINKNVLTDPRFYDPNAQKKMKKTKTKMSMVESFKYLAQSKYLGCIALLVMSYGISINLVEVTWKGQLKLAYPHPNDYNAFMGAFSMCTGITTMLVILIFSSNVIRRLGWTFGALVTPVMLLITGGAFFGFMIFKTQFQGMLALLGTTPLVAGVMIGATQNILSKASKYSFFDPTKEMSYIPLDAESKVKGKAAIDVVGARLGKSGGSLIQQGLILGLGSISAMAPYVALILMAIIFIWMTAARSLGKQFAQASEEMESREAEERAQAAADLEGTAKPAN
ncbi:MAG: ADP,ATP carrier protein 1 [Chlamydiia bacterium]|nr:ADP,ATP carrier protein 1 [Chlamydiia bacterium]